MHILIKFILFLFFFKRKMKDFGLGKMINKVKELEIIAFQ